MNLSTLRTRYKWTAACSLSALLSSCGPSLYHLPEPPAPENSVVVDLDGGGDERASARHYLEVRQQLVKLYNLLSTQRFDEATDNMSVETREFLKRITGTDSVVDALSRETLTLDGRSVAFEPVQELLADDLEVVKDAADGFAEQETARRKEIFVTPSGQQPVRIVFIREGDKWVLHRTRLKPR